MGMRPCVCWSVFQYGIKSYFYFYLFFLFGNLCFVWKFYRKFEIKKIRQPRDEKIQSIQIGVRMTMRRNLYIMTMYFSPSDHSFRQFSSGCPKYTRGSAVAMKTIGFFFFFLFSFGGVKKRYASKLPYHLVYIYTHHLVKFYFKRQKIYIESAEWKKYIFKKCISIKNYMKAWWRHTFSRKRTTIFTGSIYFLFSASHHSQAPFVFHLFPIEKKKNEKAETSLRIWTWENNKIKK